MFHCCNDQIAVWINSTWIQSLFCECHKRRMMTFDSGRQVNIGFLLPVKIPGQELLFQMHFAIGNIWLKKKSVARICRIRFCSWITFKMRFYTSILYPLRNVFAIRLSWLTGWLVGCWMCVAFCTSGYLPYIYIVTNRLESLSFAYRMQFLYIFCYKLCMLWCVGCFLRF